MKIEPNALFECDCLLLLERMGSETVNLVYLDPRGDVDDSGDRTTTEKGIENEQEDHYLIFMSKVLQQAQRVLLPDGNLFVYINSERLGTTSLLLEGIFGKENFRWQIVHPIMRPRASRLGSGHNVILYYSRSEDSQYSVPMRELSRDETKRRYSLSDDRGPYRLNDLTRSVSNPVLSYSWNGVVPPRGRGWKFSRERLDALERDGCIYWPHGGRLPWQKVYLDEHAMVEVGDVWDDLPKIVPGEERTDYPTQQSTALLKRIIEMGSRPGDIVLDVFCGSGTSVVVAQEYDRKWIACDRSPAACQIIRRRLHEVCGLSPEQNSTFVDEEQLIAEYPIVHRVYPAFYARKPGWQKLEFVLGQPIDDMIEENRKYEFKQVVGSHPESPISKDVDEYVVALLNSEEGGQVFWGVDNDRIVSGILLTYKQRDKIKSIVDQKVGSIQPPVGHTEYGVEFYRVMGPDGPVPDLHVLVVTVAPGDSRTLYYTASGKAWVKTDSGKRQLKGPQITHEVLRRYGLL